MPVEKKKLTSIIIGMHENRRVRKYTRNKYLFNLKIIFNLIVHFRISFHFPLKTILLELNWIPYSIRRSRLGGPS